MNEFLPICMEDVKARGWNEVDFVLVCGDAYVDHPSFGAALLGRMLEKEGYKVAMLSQPNVSDRRSFTVFGKPKLAFLISGGVVDSMVAHFTVSKRRRTFDEYSPGGKAGLRPDRVVDTYSRILKQLYPAVPLVVGGVEASLRRFAHYDYWDDAVRPSLLATSGADLISFGMGERSISEIAARLAKGESIETITDVFGTAHLTEFQGLPQSYVQCAGYEKVKIDKVAYAKACKLQMDNQDPFAAKPVIQKQNDTQYLVQNPPAKPLQRHELDEIYTLPFTRRWHPVYDEFGGIPALEEVEFSIIHNRGCFGGCNFCAITLHQGRQVTSRSEESLLQEAKMLTQNPGFKGYIHDVGGPTANFRSSSCTEAEKCGGKRKCLVPSPCPKLKIDHSEYLSILRKMRALPKVKKVFIRSGIRYDYLLHDRDESFFKELVAYHVSGQLKVAPEHCAPAVLSTMAKPTVEMYDRFVKRFYALSKKAGKEQYLVPYLISSHPGSTLKDAVILAQYLKKNKVRPEQVQDFYPTPGTVSTCMYYTEIDPYTEKAVFVAKSADDKAMQRALLQPHLPKNKVMATKALRMAKREDLIPLLVGGSVPQRNSSQNPRSDKNSKGKNTQKNRRKNENDKYDNKGKNNSGSGKRKDRNKQGKKPYKK